MKSGPNFKIAKQTKRMLALIIDPHERGIQKRLMIQAQLAGEVRVREKRKNEPEPTLSDQV
jgi:hypothetical protein